MYDYHFTYKPIVYTGFTTVCDRIRVMFEDDITLLFFLFCFLSELTGPKPKESFKVC